MAGETQLKDSAGETLLNSNGETAVHEDCCCGDVPCTDCPGAQNNTTVSVAGTCVSQATCHSAAGSYTYQGFVLNGDNGYCYWYWAGPSYLGQTWYIHVFHHATNGTWRIQLSHGANNPGGGNPNPDLGPPLFRESPSTDISCDKATGKLTGNASIPGMDQYKAGNCVSCTASFTL